MSDSKWNPGSGPPPTNRPVKREPARFPSPPPSCMTAVTTLLNNGQPFSSSPSCSTVVLRGGGDRGPISIRPLSAITDPDDQMSTVSGLTPPTLPKISQAVRYAQLAEDPTDWRYSISTVGARLRHILESDNKYQDVIFDVEGSTGKEQIKAHKLILRIASPVFDRMFQEAETNLTTKEPRGELIIPVKDVEPSVFKFLLKYVYTDVVDMAGLDENNMLPLLQAAKVYGVRHLYLECVKLFRKNISDEVAVKLCELASSYGDKLLLETALDHIANKAFAIFPSENFLRLSQENVLKLFTRDDLRIDEATLFEAAVEWGKHNCRRQGLDDKTPANVRKTIQRLVAEIRFPLMSPEEFTLLVTPTNLLSPEEQVGIYQYLCVDRSNQSKLPPISFKTTPRRSQKNLDMDMSSESESDSDYNREPSSASSSPEQVQRSSASNRDCVDITTEAESETASNVSAYSDSRNTGRKLSRALSNASSTSSHKRRKIDKESPQHKKFERPTTLRMDDLFGDDGNRAIKLENANIKLNDFIKQLSQNERLREIESIELNNVRIEDSKCLEGRKIYFPRLKRFELNIVIAESISAILGEDRLFKLKNYIFFGFKHGSWEYERLWRESGITDLTVIINKVIVLRMSQENGHVTLNKFSDSPRILKTFKDTKNIKSLVYSHTYFSDKIFPLSLQRMVLLGSGNSQSMSSFLKQFKHLKELTTVVPIPNSSELTLDAEFSSKDKIRKLGLGNYKLYLQPTIRFYNIVTLSLWRVTWESYFEDKFHHTFPKLKELTLIGPVTSSAKLLRNIIKISSLTDVVIWSCDFRLDETDGNDMKLFLIDCGLSDKSKSFTICRKSTEKKEWKGSKFKFSELNPCVYSKLEYGYLYEDIQAFTS